MLTIRFTFLVLLISHTAQAQVTIYGTVTGDGEPLIGANIYVAGTYDGTSSDNEGNFRFSTYEKGKVALIVSYLGYEKKSIPLTIDGKDIQLSPSLKASTASLEAVEISAGVFEAGDEKRGVALSRLDVVTTAGALADIPSAINTLPGTQSVGEAGQLFVRGGDAYESQSFMDGLPIPDFYSSQVPNLPSRGRFSPFLFSGTMFSSGGYSAEYGQALSSALILNTDELPDESRTGISLMSVGTELSHTQRWKKIALSASANMTHLGPYHAFIPQTIDWKKDPFSYGGYLFARAQPKAGESFKAFTSYSFSDAHAGMQDILTPDTYSYFRAQNTNFYTNGTFSKLLSDKWLVYGGGIYSKNAELLAAPQGQIQNDRTYSQAKLVSQHHLSSSLTLKGGIEGGYFSLSDILNDGTQDFPFSREGIRSAAFAESQWKPNKQIAIRAGMRVEQDGLIEEIAFAPRFSAAIRAHKDAQFSLAYGKYYQSPAADWLRITTDLAFEEAEHFILNYQWQGNNQIFRVEGYYKKYQNLVLFGRESPYDPSGFSNEGEGYARGVDIFWRDRKTFNNGEYWVSYSFLDTERQYRDFPEKAIPAFASKHNISVVGKYFLNEWDSQIGLSYNLTSPRPYHDPNETGFLTGKTPTNHTVSINASYLTQLFNHFTVVHFSVGNILGNNQIYGYRFTDLPDDTGHFASQAISPPARRFFFIGIFLSISQSNDSIF
ncbi:MAG: TonB-dependent receptor [Bacteroidota bacterium]